MPAPSRKPRPVTAARRHDYARIWRGLEPAERDSRISNALERWMSGETLAQIGATWDIAGSTLCQALLAYAPQTWRDAQIARATARVEQAAIDDERARGEVNIAYAHRVLKLRLMQLDRALVGLAGRCDLRRLGNEYIGPCPKCDAREGVYVSGRREPWCYLCGWKGKRAPYLLGQYLRGKLSPSRAAR